MVIKVELRLSGRRLAKFIIFAIAVALSLHVF